MSEPSKPYVASYEEARKIIQSLTDTQRGIMLMSILVGKSIAEAIEIAKSYA